MKLKKIVVVVILVVAVSALSACNKRPAEGVVIAGSTSVQPYVEVLAEAYALEHPESVIDVQGGGSSAGITAAESGIADIGMSSRDLKDEETELWDLEIAKDGLAVITHPGNPISGLELQQVCDIYSGEITDWSEFGGDKAKIHIIAREEGSGTRSAFESLVMGKSEISAKAIVQDSNGAVKQLVADDPHSIGFISLGLADYTVKPLWLDGVEPTRDNVINGSYTLFRPFLFVMKDKPTGDAAKFIEYIMSEQGQETLASEGLIPATEDRSFVPFAERNGHE